MGQMVKLLDKAPDVEWDNGLLYVCLGGQRVFAYPPHVARIANERVRRALDEMDAANSEKIVAFR